MYVCMYVYTIFLRHEAARVDNNSLHCLGVLYDAVGTFPTEL